MRRDLLPLFAPVSLLVTLLTGCAGGDDPGTDGADLGMDTDADTDDAPPPGDTADEPPAGDTTGAEPSDDSGEDGSTGDPADDTAPVVISMSPADGESGVLADAQVIVTFSEPMDKAVTQQAFQSPDLGSVTMTWNAAGDELTITPAEFLEWSFVESPADPAIAYAYAITTVARDLAGNELEQDAAASFTTMRGQHVLLTLDGEMSGSVTQGGDNAFAVDFLPLLFIGDTVGNDTWAGLMTYRFDDLPEETIGLAGGLFLGTQAGPNGNPFGDVGDVTMQTVSYENLVPAQETIPSDHDYGVVSTSMAPSVFEVDVSQEVITRFEEGYSSIQFRVRADGSSDGNGDDDTLWLPSEGAQLWVTAAYP
jgi:hypothetical protein